MFEPAHEAHAIDKVSVSITFSSFILGAPWLAVIFAAAAFSSDHDLTYVVDPLPNDAMPGSPAGISFSNMSSDGKPLVELILYRNEIKINSYSYIRWKGFIEFIQDVSNSILTQCPNDIPVYQITLEYWDRFISVTPTDPWSQVFAPGGRLPDLSVREHGPWHAYLGWFEPFDAHRVLINVHVDTLDQSEPSGGPLRSAFIYTMVALRFEAGTPTIQAILASQANELGRLHDLSKCVTGMLLTEEMQNRISLSTKEADT